MNQKYERSARPLLIFSYIVMALFLAGYIIIYQLSPFEVPWNDAILNTINALSAALAAVMATLIFLRYEQDDLPRIVWKNLMIACWLWFAGEVIWSYYNLTLGEVPFSAADGVWVAGFIFFTLALYHQYSLITPSRKYHFRNVAIGAWIVTLLIPLVIVFTANTLDLQAYVEYFYPFADLAVGITGILLVFIFQGGALMRPWIGLVVMGVTDFLYAWAEQTGIYAWSEEQSNLLSLFIDVTYMAAYLILALGFLGHWILMRYGTQARQDRD